jgi:sterol desaturase/sphingolipid hydroxylase (fatty acid hydroxylase superfamily)
MHHSIQSLALDIFRLLVWLILLAIIFVPLERLTPQNKQKVFRPEFLVDLGHYFVNSLLPKVMLILPISIIAWATHLLQPIGLYKWVGNLPFLLRFFLAIIIGEFGAYWIHRWSHENPWLWRFHCIHHSAKEIDWLVNTRAHPLDIFFTRFCGLLLVYIVGLAQPSSKTADLLPMLYTFVGTIWSFFVHANVCWRFGFLEKLVATPAFHHWHHTNDDPKHIDKNYAAMLPIMDILFGTFYLPKNRWPTKYGIDRPIAPSFTEQILEPLRITTKI